MSKLRVFCRQCGAQFEVESRKAGQSVPCPLCQTRNCAPSEALEVVLEQARMRRRWRRRLSAWCTLGLAALAGVGFVARDLLAHGNRWGASSAARRAVLEALVSPSSAKFGPAEAEHRGGGLWEVSGRVDSDNAFGASLRDGYCARVEWSGGRWEARELNFESQQRALREAEAEAEAKLIKAVDDPELRRAYEQDPELRRRYQELERVGKVPSSKP